MKTVFHLLIKVCYPNVKYNEKDVKTLVKSTMRDIALQIKPMCDTYKLKEYGTNKNLTVEEFKQLVIFIGLMDIYGYNLLISDSEDTITFVHHLPFFSRKRKTLVCKMYKDEVKLVSIEDEKE